MEIKGVELQEYTRELFLHQEFLFQICLVDELKLGETTKALNTWDQLSFEGAFKYHLDQKVLGLDTVWRSRSADFNPSFFVVLVEVSLRFCQIFRLTA